MLSNLVLAVIIRSLMVCCTVCSCSVCERALMVGAQREMADEPVAMTNERQLRMAVEPIVEVAMERRALFAAEADTDVEGVRD